MYILIILQIFLFFKFMDIFNKSTADYQKTYQAKLPVWLLLNIYLFLRGNPLCFREFVLGTGVFFLGDSNRTRGYICSPGFVGGIGGGYFLHKNF